MKTLDMHRGRDKHVNFMGWAPHSCKSALGSPIYDTSIVLFKLFITTVFTVKAGATVVDNSLFIRTRRAENPCSIHILSWVCKPNLNRRLAVGANQRIEHSRL